MNEIINMLLLAGDKLVLVDHLLKTKREKSKQAGDSRYIYENYRQGLLSTLYSF